MVRTLSHERCLTLLPVRSVLTFSGVQWGLSHVKGPIELRCTQGNAAQMQKSARTRPFFLMHASWLATSSNGSFSLDVSALADAGPAAVSAIAFSG